jgi:hypothetical protein
LLIGVRWSDLGKNLTLFLLFGFIINAPPPASPPP